MPHSYETNYSSLKQSRFSVDNSRFGLKNQRGANDSYLTQEESFDNKSVGVSGSELKFNAGGRPIFAKDADKHMTPAPSQYKPDRFIKYDLDTKL